MNDTPVSTISDNHQLEVSTFDYDTGFTVTTASAERMSLSRFDRDGHHHTSISLHDVTDLNIDMDDKFGPTLTMLVGGERVTINLFLAPVAA